MAVIACLRSFCSCVCIKAHEAHVALLMACSFGKYGGLTPLLLAAAV